ncbi:MAG: hypothetical protein ABSF44_08820 [Candidatus Bathyarchaeia archaeon]|jgi:hypothetical protein
MGNCDYWLFGKELEIDKLGDICKGVGELLKVKFGPAETGSFRDWTGISDFLICYKDLQRTLHEQKNPLYSKKEIREEWRGCPLDEGEAAIWWVEIEWAHKVPTEVWSYMFQEGKRLGIQQLVENTIHKWGAEDDLIFNLIETELGKGQYPSTPV